MVVWTKAAVVIWLLMSARLSDSETETSA